MKLADFETAVMELAHGGTRLTVPNVAVNLKINRDKAEKWLDELAAQGKLDTDVDMDEGVLVYRFPGLTVKDKGSDVGNALADLSSGAKTAATVGTALGALRGGGSSSLAKNKKNVPLGVILGLIIPGAGLFYAAPWAIAIVGTLGAALVYWLSGIPLIGSILVMVYALCSAVLGGIYAYAYNRNGKRTHVKLPGTKRLKG